MPTHPQYACTAPLAIDGGGTVVAYTGGLLAGSYAGGCGGAGQADEVYSFTLGASAMVDTDSTGSGFTVTQYIRAVSCTAGAEQGCRNTAGTLSTTLAAGTYYLFVDALPLVPDYYRIRFDP